MSIKYEYIIALKFIAVIAVGISAAIAFSDGAYAGQVFAKGGLLLGLVIFVAAAGGALGGVPFVKSAAQRRSERERGGD